MKLALGACVDPERVEVASVRPRFRTAEEKRRIVEQTLSSDVSVASIAREHGVNANQVFTGGSFTATVSLLRANNRTRFGIFRLR